MRRLLPALAVLLLLTTPVAAQDFDAGWAAYEKHDYATAIRTWRTLAEKGDAASQTALGSLHYMGRGVPHDHAEALRLYRLAAETGYPTAMFNLGLFYFDPHGEPNFVKAHKWFNLAADKGMQEASWRLGRVADMMTAEQIAEAQRMAREWMEKHQK